MALRPGHLWPQRCVHLHCIWAQPGRQADSSQQAESFSMHGPIHQHLLNGGLERLNKLGEDLLAKREGMMPTIGCAQLVNPVRKRDILISQ